MAFSLTFAVLLMCIIILILLFLIHFPCLLTVSWIQFICIAAFCPMDVLCSNKFSFSHTKPLQPYSVRICFHQFLTMMLREREKNQNSSSDNNCLSGYSPDRFDMKLTNEAKVINNSVSLLTTASYQLTNEVCLEFIKLNKINALLLYLTFHFYLDAIWGNSPF